jgi:hypothetical protein
MHTEQHSLAGQTIVLDQIEDISDHPKAFTVEDWWDRLDQGSWLMAAHKGNFAAKKYAARICDSETILPDDEVVYGKIDGLGHLIHVSELPDAVEEAPKNVRELTLMTLNIVSEIIEAIRIEVDQFSDERSASVEALEGSLIEVAEDLAKIGEIASKIVRDPEGMEQRTEQIIKVLDAVDGNVEAASMILDGLNSGDASLSDFLNAAFGIETTVDAS